MKRLQVPDSLVLIFAMVLAAQLLSYAVPSGVFERVVTESGQEQVQPGTYHQVETDPLPPFAFLSAIPRGMAAAADIIFFIFIVGGAVAVVRATGSIDALLGAAVRRLGSSPGLLIGGMLSLFALGSATIGMGEEYIPFVPVLVSMCAALGMGATVAVGMVSLGVGIGYGCAALNPFTVVVAQNIAGVPLYSGQLYRWALFVIFLAIGVHHLIGYANRTRGEPKAGEQLVAQTPFSAGRIVLLSGFAASIALFVYGVAVWQWYLAELSAVFVGLTLFAAVCGRIGPNRLAAEFTKGAAELTYAALLVGFARAIEVILDDAVIKDTVIHGIAIPLERMPAAVAALGMLAVQSVFNLLVPSGSGQAFITMPIMAPLADLTGVGRQTAVLAYQFGDGLTNMIVPTSGVLMSFLALAKIPYGRWARFVVPLLGKFYAAAALALVIPTVTGWRID